MKKLLVIVLCLALTLPVLALAEGDGRVHITYSFWGNQTARARCLSRNS